MDNFIARLIVSVLKSVCLIMGLSIFIPAKVLVQLSPSDSMWLIFLFSTALMDWMYDR